MLEQRQLDLIGLGLVGLGLFFGFLVYLGWEGGRAGSEAVEGLRWLLDRVLGVPGGRRELQRTLRARLPVVLAEWGFLNGQVQPALSILFAARVQLRHARRPPAHQRVLPGSREAWMLLGLLGPSAGEVTLFGGPPSGHTRGRLGYVPQSYALFPHLTVARNVAFGLRGRPQRERRRRVDELPAVVTALDPQAPVGARGPEPFVRRRELGKQPHADGSSGARRRARRFRRSPGRGRAW